MTEHPHVRLHAPALGAMAGVESPYVIGDGTMVPVRRLWAAVKEGKSPEALVMMYPKLGTARVFDALAYCYDNTETVEADLTRESRAIAEWKERRT